MLRQWVKAQVKTGVVCLALSGFVVAAFSGWAISVAGAATAASPASTDSTTPQSQRSNDPSSSTKLRGRVAFRHTHGIVTIRAENGSTFKAKGADLRVRDTVQCERASNGTMFCSKSLVE